MSDLDERERFVLKAAGLVEAAYSRQPPDCDEEAKAVAILVDAYRALTAPKAVRPSEVEPGTRFRFVNATHRHGRQGYCRLIMAGPQRMWHSDGKVAALFYDDDLLIPVED